MTLDPWHQLAAERTIAGLIAVGASRRVGEAALVSMQTDGQVMALVGGRDFGASQWDAAIQAARPAASTYKLAVYLAALEQGLEPGSPVPDAPIADGWPRNPGGRYHGTISLAEALAHSLNGAAVRLALKVGLSQVARMGARLGLAVPPDAHDPALALGTAEVTLLDLTAAYAVVAAHGRRVTPVAMLGVLDARGAVLGWRTPPAPDQVVARRHADAMAWMLTQVIARGTGRQARLDRPAAGKTGTSSGFRDAWFVGFSSDLVTGIWAGNRDNAPMAGVAGGSLPARAWARFTAFALERLDRAVGAHARVARR